MTVYLLSKRGTLHKAEQSEAGFKSFEADNLDSAQVTVYGSILSVPTELVKRSCKRCFPEGSK